MNEPRWFQKLRAMNHDDRKNALRALSLVDQIRYLDSHFDRQVGLEQRVSREILDAIENNPSVRK